MKKTLLWLLPLFIFSFLSSCEPEGPADKDPDPPVAEEIIEIPDEYFKNVLVNTNSIDTNGDHVGDSNIDLNNDGEIQRSEAELAKSLIMNYNYHEIGRLVSFTGISNFTNLEYLKITGIGYYPAEEIEVEKLMSYDFTGLVNLEYLEFNNLVTNWSESLDLSGLGNLAEVRLINNSPFYEVFTDENIVLPVNFMDVDLESTGSLINLDITNSFLNIDFCQVPSLKKLNMFYLEGGEPEVFDFHCLESLEWLNIGENVIESLILSNSSVLETLLVQNIGSWGGHYWNYPFVKYICIDDIPEEHEQIATLIDEHTVVVTDCSF
ncbi:hypothetical protein [Salinimicrobium sp. TH3]|uniref:hypothetical protein n=1 Tax=Salinimicrobium sp. TH3 TaxID=2997342 RepID=UPI002272ED39|nr:hypothetical protein [Salinimicrobium sp. TH3]MCY2686023.1 hypothetical protein [Salinimicrobium sp. TH3]